MKKLIAVFAILSLVICFAACGANTEKETAAPTDVSEESANPNVPYLIINNEPYVVTAAQSFDNFGVTALLCDADETYSFTSSSPDTEWKVFVLDSEFTDGARYLPQAETPALEGDGDLAINEGKYIYILCSESSFSADAPSDAYLTIDYSGIPDEEGIEPAVDVTDCKTFDDVTAKLSEGMAYANETVDGTEVLLVAPSTFDNNLGEGERYDAAVEADVFYIDDGAVRFMGKIKAGGSSYPLAIKDGKIYVGNNHGMCIETVDAELGTVLIDNEAYIKFDSEGNESYYHRSDVSGAKGDDGLLEDDSLLKEYLTAYGDAEVIKFTPAGK